jgi:hypothetical protein
MAVSVLRKSNLEFERHVKHLAWFALVASIALLTPATRAAPPPGLELVVALGSLVLVVAVWMVVVSVPKYVRAQQARAFELAKASHLEGACQTAEGIQDRVANLLSITVGYAEFLVDDERVPVDARERAQQALDGALAAARVVSTFKEALGCHGRPLVELAESEPLPRVPVPTQPRIRHSRGERSRWLYDASHRRVTASDGVNIAMLAPELDAPAAAARGRLIAEAPALWQVVDEAQQLGAKLLADARLTQERTAELQALLQRITDVTARLDAIDT